MDKVIYKTGKLVKQIDETVWQFEVDSKLYENNMITALDTVFPKDAAVGMTFQISELALDASRLD